MTSEARIYEDMILRILLEVVELRNKVKVLEEQHEAMFQATITKKRRRPVTVSPPVPVTPGLGMSLGSLLELEEELS